MSKINDFLSERFRLRAGSKTAALAQKSSQGGLTSFSGIFGSTELSEEEKAELAVLLQNHAEEGADLEEDLKTLSGLTSEVKGINNQAALLHGERIQRAKTLLKSYKEGAFTLWMIRAYGNRQTPYNFLQYYEFYHSSPKDLQPVIEAMPKQAVYTLASRGGSSDQKLSIVKAAAGKSKNEILTQIKAALPLASTDRRQSSSFSSFRNQLERLALEAPSLAVNEDERQMIQSLLHLIGTNLR